MTNYIFITYQAILLFASDRFLQSSENEASSHLCNVLRLQSKDWPHSRIHMYKTERGIIFYTNDSTSKEGVLFDLSTFKGFMEDDRTVINIFQKTMKYAIRYYSNLPLANCERQIPDSTITVIYPNPFVATRGVPKVLLDRNSSKLNKKGVNFLTVFDYNTDGKSSPSFTNLYKAYEDIRNLNFKLIANDAPKVDTTIRGFSSTVLDNKDIKLDANIGYDNWLEHYLTDVQRKFVCSDILGPERLEGAAGTGKTISLILRSIYILKKHIEDNSEFHMIFFTHSLSTKERIINIFKSNWEDFEFCEEEKGTLRPRQSIKVTTLQEWSAEHLGTNSISENEYLDKDAAESKGLQILYIEEAYNKTKEDLWESSFDLLCSERFKNFLSYTPEESLLELFRLEIAILFKGRAGCDFDRYKKITRPLYSLPLEVDADFRFVNMVFKKYQDSLAKIGQYDTDDITLSALGHVCTPIWNRRRMREGYDACIIDETHLFNINELSVFHYVTKLEDQESGGSPKILFAIDKSQATGDWGMDDVSISNALQFETDSNNSQFKTVFRCSPDIVNLAFNILSSGANIFTNFENPLLYSSFDFIKEEDAKSIEPEYTLLENDNEAIIEAVDWAERYCTEKRISKNNVLIIGTNDALVEQIGNYLLSHKKPFEKLVSRSDEASMKKAREGNKFVVSQIDYVGGLEFDAVVIIGVDTGRVPPSRAKDSDAYHVVSYAWHSRMYVAVTRAKYAVKLLGDMSRGASELLYSSILSNSVEYEGPSILGQE